MFVLTDFKSPDYDYLYKNDNRIVGPPVVLHCAAKEEVRDSQRLAPISPNVFILPPSSQFGIYIPTGREEFYKKNGTVFGVWFLKMKLIHKLLLMVATEKCTPVICV